MSRKQLQLINNFTKSTANDTETCSLCHSAPKLFKSREISRRHNVCHQKVGQSFTMLHKFLLIYALVFLMFSPLILCMRHQHNPNGVVNHMTPATNSIDNEAILSVRSEVSSSEASEEESEEDYDETTPPPHIVKEAYEQQARTFTKVPPIKAEIKNVRTTAATPSPPRHRENQAGSGSCSSSMCQSRKNIEEANTESIKKHILMKLGMEHEPKKTSYPKYKEEDLVKLCKRMNISVDNCLNRKSPSVEYQSDDPTDMIFDDFDGDHEAIVASDEDVQFLSYENRIYAFPSSK